MKVVGILLYTRIVRVFPKLQGLMKVAGILLYTHVVRVFLEPKVLSKSRVYFYIPML